MVPYICYRDNIYSTYIISLFFSTLKYLKCDINLRKSEGYERNNDISNYNFSIQHNSTG